MVSYDDALHNLSLAPAIFALCYTIPPALVLLEVNFAGCCIPSPNLNHISTAARSKLKMVWLNAGLTS